MVTSMKVDLISGRQSYVALFAAFVLLGGMGCGQKLPPAPVEKLVPVSGKVTLGGKPAERAIITFTPSGNNRNARIGNGFVDAEGDFEISNYQGKPGLPVGTYTVTLSLVLTADGKFPEGNKPPQAEPFQAIPPEWNVLSNVGMHNAVTVPEGGKTDFDFKIPAKNK
jgi:hypothetical protein